MGALGLIIGTLGLGLVAAALYFYNNYTATNELQVKTTRGWVEGGYTTTRGGRKVMEFLGIPYAKAPVKELSFKDPVEPDLWGKVRNATVECGPCLQQFVMVESLRDKVIGEMNCLCVNVYTPKASTSRKLPVIFFIHGSAYIGLSMAKSFYGPDMLLDKDVVVVTASYRLGVLGFLTTEDSVIPGNWAMKDQALALRWVKDNIKNFGGDPNSITLMGESSGAGSVHLHMLSPLTKDLFHRAIMHSGSGLCLWGFSEPGVLKARSKRVAELIGCPFHPSENFLECLQKTNSTEIVDTTRKFLVWDEDPVAFWNPVVEGSDVKGAFLTGNPHTLSATSTKPLLAGFNYAEGMMKIASLLSGDANNVNSKFREWNMAFDRITPVSLLYDTKAFNPADVTNLVRKFYIGPPRYGVWQWVGPIHLPQLIRMFGDFWFINGVLDAVEKHSGPKYLFHFNYNTSVSVCNNLYNIKSYYGGACHLDELMYLFPMEVKSDNFMNHLSKDYNQSLIMVELWTNFVKNSVPSASEALKLTWNPVKSPQMEHLEITNGGFEMKTDPIGDRRTFWKSLKFRRA